MTIRTHLPRYAAGSELRFLVDGELHWSEVFKPGRGIVLGEIAETKRAEFEARGWKSS